MARTGMKSGHVKTIYLLIKDGKMTSYPEICAATSLTRNQVARAVKYLRSEGHVIRTIPKGGHYPAILQYMCLCTPIHKGDTDVY